MYQRTGILVRHSATRWRLLSTKLATNQYVICQQISLSKASAGLLKVPKVQMPQAGHGMNDAIQNSMEIITKVIDIWPMWLIFIPNIALVKVKKRDNDIVSNDHFHLVKLSVAKAIRKALRNGLWEGTWVQFISFI